MVNYSRLKEKKITYISKENFILKTNFRNHGITFSSSKVIALFHCLSCTFVKISFSFPIIFQKVFFFRWLVCSCPFFFFSFLLRNSIFFFLSKKRLNFLKESHVCCICCFLQGKRL